MGFCQRNKTNPKDLRYPIVIDFLFTKVVVSVMSQSNRQSDCQSREDARCIIPAGTPNWITPELVEATVRTWQPYYQAPLSIDDAIEMIRNAGLLFNMLASHHPGPRKSG